MPDIDIAEGRVKPFLGESTAPLSSPWKSQLKLSWLSSQRSGPDKLEGCRRSCNSSDTWLLSCLFLDVPDVSQTIALQHRSRSCAYAASAEAGVTPWWGRLTSKSQRFSPSGRGRRQNPELPRATGELEHPPWPCGFSKSRQAAHRVGCQRITIRPLPLGCPDREVTFCLTSRVLGSPSLDVFALMELPLPGTLLCPWSPGCSLQPCAPRDLVNVERGAKLRFKESRCRVDIGNPRSMLQDTPRREERSEATTGSTKDPPK